MRTLCKSFMALTFLCLSINLCLAQKAQETTKYFVEDLQDLSIIETAKYKDAYYLEVSFDRIPQKSLLQQLTQKGVQLLEYRSNNKYLVKVPAKLNPSALTALGITHIQQQAVEQKLTRWSTEQEYPSWVSEVAGKLDVAFVFHESVAQSDIQEFIATNNIEILEGKHRGNYTIVARINEDALENLAASPIVSFIDMEQEPIQMLNREVCVNQKNNVLNSTVPGGYGLKGEGVTIGIGDGGQLGQHIDFGNRVINKANGTYSSFGDHGDHVAGIIGGAGNLNPRHQGNASEATIITQKTSQVTYRTEEYVNAFDMVLTNNSYGTSFNCATNGSYNYSAQTLDWQLREFPEVLHVFAAGNSGGGTCDPFPQGYHTVLRYYQSAKNVLTVGMAEENRTIANSSSRGPVKDGRLKPEVIGIGRNVISTSNDYNYSTKGGTSMSAPAVTGTLGLLVEKYRLENGGENPKGALVKAIACNTADDLGNPGPDFIHGFGLINGRRAVEAIENNQYYSEEISDNEMHTQTINVPSGVSQAKFMLYWHDKEAAVYPDKALVNDLDISIVTPSGETILPWVLDPSSEGVDDVAVRGYDHLNNIEQITIDFPAAGSYNIIVRGTEVAFGPQEFISTYDFVREEVILTYPLGGESFLPNANEYISWDADITNTSTFKLEFSIDGGSNWLMIAPALAADQRTYNWTVPQNFSPDAKVRVTKNDNGIADENETVFYIMDKPTEVAVESTCESQAFIEWTEVEYAVAYDVFMYDGDIMSLVGSTTETSYVVDEGLEIGEMYWFSVRAVGMDGSKSERTIAKSLNLEYVELCPWDDNPIVVPVYQIARGRALTSDGLEDEKVSLTVRNLGANDLESFEMFYSINGGAPIQETFNGLIESGATQEIKFETAADLSAVGMHYVDFWVEITDNNFFYNDGVINLAIAEQLRNDKVFLPYTEDFSSAESKLYTEDQLGLAECLKWDFEHNGTGQLEIIQDEALVLRPIVPANGNPLNNSARLTLNLSEYANMDEDVELSFAYQVSGAAPATFVEENLANAVYVRGRDTDEWVKVFTLMNKVGGWLEVDGLKIRDLLAENGQQFTASTQFRFTNDNNYTIGIKDIQLVTAQVGVETALEDDFTLTQVGDDVLLTWTPTDTEEIYYEIEVLDFENYDNDEEDFDVIGTVQAERTTTQPYYTFVDEAPGIKGTRYYRIKQVFSNGMVTYSPVLSITINHKEISGVFPNPFLDKFTIAYDSKMEGIVNIQVIAPMGERIIKQDVEVSGGMQFIPVKLDERNPPGAYYVVITGKHRVAMYHKIVKQ